MSLRDALKTRPCPVQSTLLYGPPGTGKTSFAAGAPDSYYFDVEGSLGPLAETVPHDKPTGFEDLMTKLTAIYKDPTGIGSVVIDTLDAVMPLIDARICELRGVSNVADLNKKDGYGSSGAAQAQQMLRVMNAMEAIASKGVWPIMLAHSAVKTLDNPLGESVASIEPKFPKPVNAVIIEKARIIMYSSTRKMTKEVDDGARSIAVTADPTCYLTVQPSGAIIAKNQYNLPNGIIRTEWPAFIAAFNKAKGINP